MILILAFLVTMVLIVFKALGLITWPWVLLFLPLMAWLGYAITMVIIGLAMTGLGLLILWWTDREGL